MPGTSNVSCVGVTSFQSPTSVPTPASVTDRTAEVLRFALKSKDEGYRVALALLTRIDGGAARSPGSMMAIREDGKYCGFVSGGCTEAAVAAEAVRAIEDDEDRSVIYGLGSPFFDIVLPCGGGITISIHVLGNADAVKAVLSQLSLRRRTALSYRPKLQALEVSDTLVPTGWIEGAFTTQLRPQTRIFLSGGPIEMSATATLARAAGYDVHCHEGGSFQQDIIDCDTAVASLHHDLDRDLVVLSGALASQPFYIGALGSKRTQERRVRALQDLGYTSADISRIKSPIGIFPKARHTHSLALSVLADIAYADTLVDRALES